MGRRVEWALVAILLSACGGSGGSDEDGGAPVDATMEDATFSDAVDAMGEVIPACWSEPREGLELESPTGVHLVSFGESALLFWSAIDVGVMTAYARPMDTSGRFTGDAVSLGPGSVLDAQALTGSGAAVAIRTSESLVWVLTERDGRIADTATLADPGGAVALLAGTWLRAIARSASSTTTVQPVSAHDAVTDPYDVDGSLWGSAHLSGDAWLLTGRDDRLVLSRLDDADGSVAEERTHDLASSPLWAGLTPVDGSGPSDGLTMLTQDDELGALLTFRVGEDPFPLGDVTITAVAPAHTGYQSLALLRQAPGDGARIRLVARGFGGEADLTLESGAEPTRLDLASVFDTFPTAIAVWANEEGITIHLVQCAKPF